VCVILQAVTSAIAAGLEAYAAAVAARAALFNFRQPLALSIQCIMIWQRLQPFPAGEAGCYKGHVCSLYIGCYMI
jgi:hypothetical protein